MPKHLATVLFLEFARCCVIESTQAGSAAGGGQRGAAESGCELAWDSLPCPTASRALLI